MHRKNLTPKTNISYKLLLISSLALSGCLATTQKVKQPNMKDATDHMLRSALSGIDIFESTKQLPQHGINVTEKDGAIHVSYQTESRNPYLFKDSRASNLHCKISQNKARKNSPEIFGHGEGLGLGTPYLYYTGGKIIKYTEYAESFIKVSKNQDSNNSFWDTYESICAGYVSRNDINPKNKILQPHYYVAETCTNNEIRQCNAIIFYGETIKDHAFSIAKLDRERYDAITAREIENRARERMAIDQLKKEEIELNKKTLPQKTAVGASLCFQSKSTGYTPTYFVRANVEGSSGSRIKMRVANISSITPPSYTLEHLSQYVLNGNQLKPNMIFWDEAINWKLCK